MCVAFVTSISFFSRSPGFSCYNIPTNQWLAVIKDWFIKLRNRCGFLTTEFIGNSGEIYSLNYSNGCKFELHKPGAILPHENLRLSTLGDIVRVYLLRTCVATNVMLLNWLCRFGMSLLVWLRRSDWGMVKLCIANLSSDVALRCVL